MQSLFPVLARPALYLICRSPLPAAMLLTGPWLLSSITVLAFVAALLSVEAQAAGDCSLVQKLYVTRGFPLADVASRPTSGSQLAVCSASTTCCTKAMEQHLTDAATSRLHKVFGEKLRRRLTPLAKHRHNFETQMRNILKVSYDKMHNMFARTYGYIYLSHSKLFEQFFESLQRYFRGEIEDVGKQIDAFFDVLQERMVPMLVKESRTDNNLRKCILRELSQGRPFGEAPNDIKSSLRRSLVTTRTFAMILAHQHDLIQRISERVLRTLSRDCTNALTRMSECSLCSGLQLRPCQPFCHNVMYGCLSQLFDIIPSWQQLNNNMKKLVERIKAPQIIGRSLNSLGVKVSTGIMDFQKQFQSRKERSPVLSKCQGRPGRQKRAAKQKPLRRLNRQNRQKNRNRPNFGREEEALASLIQKINTKILAPQGSMWTDLMRAPCPNDARCWNGSALAPYEARIVGSSRDAQVSNPEVVVDTSVVDRTIANAKQLLQRLSDSARRACFNAEVKWIAPAPPALAPKPLAQLPNSWRSAAGARPVEGSGDGRAVRPLPSRVGAGVVKAPQDLEGSGRGLPLPPAKPSVPVAKPQPSLIPARPPPDDESGKEGSGLAPSSAVPTVPRPVQKPLRPTLKSNSSSSSNSNSRKDKSGSRSRNNQLPKRPTPPSWAQRPKPPPLIEGSGGAPVDQERSRPLPQRPGTWPGNNRNNNNNNNNNNKAWQRPNQRLQEKGRQQIRPGPPTDDVDGGSGDGRVQARLPQRTLPEQRKWIAPKATYPSAVWVPKEKDPSKSGYQVLPGPSSTSDPDNAACGRLATSQDHLFFAVTAALAASIAAALIGG